MKKAISLCLIVFSINAKAGMYDDLCLEYGPIQKNKIAEVDIGVAKKIKVEKKMSLESIEKKLCECTKVELFSILVQKFQHEGLSTDEAFKTATKNVNKKTYEVKDVEFYLRAYPKTVRSVIHAAHI